MIQSMWAGCRHGGFCGIEPLAAKHPRRGLPFARRLGHTGKHEDRPYLRHDQLSSDPSWYPMSKCLSITGEGLAP